MLLAFRPQFVQANVMPVYEDLRRTESAHFIYIYQVSLAPQLPELVKLCEETFDLLTSILHWAPRGKTIVLYADSLDEHNGAAWVHPRATVLLYAAGSSPGSSIYEPGLFLRRTFLHEYTHVLSMDAQYGADAVLSAIFGRVLPTGDLLSLILAACAAPPGFLAPTWYLEGLAIWAETEFSNSGRGRTALADMIMRMSVAEQRSLSPKAWDLELPEWPYGEAAYLYGMKTIEYAQKLSAEKASQTSLPGELSDQVAHSFLFFFDDCARPVMGRTFDQMTRDALRQTQHNQATRIATLQSRPLTKLNRLTPEPLQAAYPRFSADSQAVFFAGKPEAGREVLYRYDCKEKRVERLENARIDFGGTTLNTPLNHKLIYYTRLNVRGRDRVWNELHCFDPATATRSLVTRLGRYRYPAISPDGRTLAAVRNESGSFSLLEVPLAAAGSPKAETIRKEAPPFHSLINPAYSPDGRSLAYVLANDEHSQLRNLDRITGADLLLVDWPCFIMTPVFHPSGSNLVFVADRNGVYNLYRQPLPFGEPQAVTHVLGGVFAPDFSPDGRELAVAAYDSRGYYLSVLTVASLTNVPAPLPVLKWDWPSSSRDSYPGRVKATNGPPVAQPLPARPPASVGPKALRAGNAAHSVAGGRTDSLLAATPVTSRPYSYLAGTRLSYWTPWLTVADGSGVQGGLAAAGADYTEALNLFALGGAESRWGTPLGSLLLQYSGSYPILSAFGAYGPETYYNLVKDKSGFFYDYNEEVGQAGGLVTLPLVRADYQADFSLGFQATDRKVITKSAEDYAGAPLVTTNLFEGTESALFAQMAFFSGTAFGRSASFEDGRALAATLERVDEAFGGELDQTRVLGQWVEYAPLAELPGRAWAGGQALAWADNHVLRLEGVGAAGEGDETAQSFFGLGGFGFVQQLAGRGLERNVILRGYDANSQVGRYLVKAGAAYRFPLLSHYEGMNATLPFYLHQVFGELYYEGGHASGGDSASALDANWLNAAGFEVNVSLTVFRYVPIAPGLGIVYAFNRKDPNPGASADSEANQKLQVYLSIKAVVNF
ncbi:MAG: PD40 domain-containing protein [Lentisphaerae bacterium]|nr:PD40 domain-containing protein [Lentisphaerota bacterium]